MGFKRKVDLVDQHSNPNKKTVFIAPYAVQSLRDRMGNNI